jgi:Putative translation factor (SUA5)
MTTTVFDSLLGSREEIIERLIEGQVGIFPCDTIYGISSKVGEAQKERILQIKRRSPSKSFISLVSKDWLRSSDLSVPEELYSIWPAPLTAILADSNGTTYAVRVPRDEELLPVIDRVGAIYSTSVNISSQASLYSFEDIYNEFAAEVDFIVKAEVPASAKPSTIINCVSRPFTLIRNGAYDASSIL